MTLYQRKIAWKVHCKKHKPLVIEIAGWYCTTVLVFVYQTINDSTVVLKSYHNIVFKFHYIQQILREVSWNEGEVVSETEDIHPSVEVDSSVNFCEEPSGSGTIIEDDHGKAKICANCNDLARKVMRKSKQKLHERLLNEVIDSCVLLIIYVGRDHTLWWTQSPKNILDSKSKKYVFVLYTVLLYQLYLLIYFLCRKVIPCLMLKVTIV